LLAAQSIRDTGRLELPFGRGRRFTHDFEDVTGHTAQTVKQYVGENRGLFS
jgi:hypothetical protein